MLRKDEELGEALRYWLDISERSLLPFVLLGQTARRIRDNQKLFGARITVGVQRKHLTKEVQGTLGNLRARAYGKAEDITEYQEYDGYFKMYCGNIPIKVIIIEEEDWRTKYLQNQDIAYYLADDFKVPNPFEDYWKERGEVIEHGKASTTSKESEPEEGGTRKVTQDISARKRKRTKIK